MPHIVRCPADLPRLGRLFVPKSRQFGHPAGPPEPGYGGRVPTPPYILDLREVWGHQPLLLPGVSGVVVDGEPGAERVLLLRRADTGQWSVPAGIVEPGEQPADCIVRELAEETRVVAVAERLVLLVADPELRYPNGDRCQFVSMTFRCRRLHGEPAVGDEESLEVAWFDAGDLPAELDARQRRRIAAALRADPGCEFDQDGATTPSGAPAAPPGATPGTR